MLLGIRQPQRLWWKLRYQDRPAHQDPKEYRAFRASQERMGKMDEQGNLVGEVPPEIKEALAELEAQEQEALRELQESLAKMARQESQGGLDKRVSEGVQDDPVSRVDRVHQDNLDLLAQLALPPRLLTFINETQRPPSR